MTAAGRRLTAASYYRGGSPLRAVHRAAKYDQNESAARWLGAYLSRHLEWARSDDSVDACVAVPSHPARLLDRGIDVAACLAARLAKDNGWTLRTDMLVRERLGIPQNELDREERLINVRSVFGIGSSKTALLHVMLVDDVVTTGATLDACADLLESRGHRVSLAALAMRREIFDLTAGDIKLHNDPDVEPGP